jgi:hypothetical protein
MPPKIRKGKKKVRKIKGSLDGDIWFVDENGMERKVRKKEHM